MSSNEESSQNAPTLSEIINPSSEININSNTQPITSDTNESKEVNDKITELVKERHANDLNEGKDDNETKVRNISFVDRLKRKSKMENLSDKIENKENEPTTLTTVNDIIIEKDEENKEEIIQETNNENNKEENKNEIKDENNNEEIKIEIRQEEKKEEKEEEKEEIKEEKKEEIKEEIKEEKEESIKLVEKNNNENEENKIEIKSISNKSKSKTPSRNNSKSSSKSKKDNKPNEESLYSNISNVTLSTKKEPKSQKIIKKNINSKSIEKRKLKNPIHKINTQRSTKSHIVMENPKKQNPKKKFNAEEFQKELEFFKQCEVRKKEKIEKLKEEKIKKEISLINDKKNIHYHKKLKKKQLPSLLERLYTKDLEKRKEKKIILQKIYTPTFTPSLYTKKNANNFKKRQNATKPKNNVNNEENNYEENMTFNESQRAYNEIRTDVNMSQKSHKIKGKVKFNNVEKNKDLDEVEESENESEKIQKRVVVENALRNKLFKFGNKQKRNKSAEPRNKK